MYIDKIMNISKIIQNVNSKLRAFGEAVIGVLMDTIKEQNRQRTSQFTKEMQQD